MAPARSAPPPSRMAPPKTAGSIRAPAVNTASSKLRHTTVTTSSGVTSSNNRSASTVKSLKQATGITSRQSIYSKPTSVSARNKTPTASSKQPRKPTSTVRLPPTPEPEPLDHDALSGPEANALRAEYEKLKIKLKEREEEIEKLKQNEENLRKEFEDRLTGLEKEIVEIKQRHEEEIREMTSELEEAREEGARSEAELLKSRERNSDLEMKLEAMVEPRVRELMKPYISAHEECESLKAVVDIKNQDVRKLQLQIREEQLKTKDSLLLNDQNEKLQREKEDLQARLSDKNQLNLSMREEMREERAKWRETCRELQQVRGKLEQLTFKQTSPVKAELQQQAPNFNPVFTQSPTSKS